MKGIRKQELNKLRKKKITLRKRKEMIRTVKCGEKLADVIKQSL